MASRAGIGAPLSCVASDVTSFPVAKWATYAMLALSTAGTGLGAKRLAERAGAPAEWSVVGYLAPAPSSQSATSIVAMVAGHELRRECNGPGACLVWLLDARREVLDSRVVASNEPVAMRMSPDRRWVVLDVGAPQTWSVERVAQPKRAVASPSWPTWLGLLGAVAALLLQARRAHDAASLREFVAHARPCTVDAHGYIRFDDRRFPRFATTRHRLRPGPASAQDSLLPTLLSYRTPGVPEIFAIREGAPADHARRLELEAPKRTTAIALSLLALVAPVAMLLG